MKKNQYILAAVCTLSLSLTSCNDWLQEETPGTTQLKDFFTGGQTAIQSCNAAYAPLAWEYDRTYCPEWFIGDVVSDDALKGGQNLTDMPDAYDMENFKTNSYNTLLHDFYRAQYEGIMRCNLVLEQVPGVEADDDMTNERKECLLGEAYFLRAYYYFRLVRVFGGVPLVDFIIDSAEKWQQPRATAENVYAHIIKDLKEAESHLWDKNKYADEDLGRATKGAAQAMLCKVYLYMKNYDDAYTWGKTFVDNQYNTGKYSLCTNYEDNFTLDGENGPESVFEIQYMEDPTSDYGGGSEPNRFGFTRGTLTTIMVRHRGTNQGEAGWGFNHPTQNLYDEFEQGDPRREATIGIPSDESDRNNAEVLYCGNNYYNKKYTMETNGRFQALSHPTRSPLNYKLIRTSDVLLMYAEAALESGKDVTAAKWALEEVRNRARAGQTDILPAFPGYNGYQDNTDDLRKAIRHERRVELGMEGHRWFDLVRWGIAYEVMDKDHGTYGKNETEEARKQMASFIKGKHELFPLPAEEVTLNPMEQNPGY